MTLIYNNYFPNSPYYKASTMTTFVWLFFWNVKKQIIILSYILWVFIGKFILSPLWNTLKGNMVFWL